jgi:hypothetical protein
LPTRVVSSGYNSTALKVCITSNSPSACQPPKDNSRFSFLRLPVFLAVSSRWRFRASFRADCQVVTGNNANRQAGRIKGTEFGTAWASQQPGRICWFEPLMPVTNGYHEPVQKMSRGAELVLPQKKGSGEMHKRLSLTPHTPNNPGFS